MREFALHTTLIQRLLRRMQRPWTRYVAKKELSNQRAFAERLLAKLARDGKLELLGAAPQITSALLTRSDVVVALIGTHADETPKLVLKLPLTSDAEQSTTSHRQVIMALHQLPNLPAFLALVPRAITWGEYTGRPYYLETALAGVGAGDLVKQKAEPAELKQDAARLIGQLHVGTAQRRVVDHASFAQLAGDDLALLQRLAARWPDAAGLRQKLNTLETRLRQQLQGRELPFAWTHGDFWPGNLLVQPANGAISGIVDWDRASVAQFPLHDLLHLLAYARKMQRRSELGEEIVNYLLPANFDTNEQSIVRTALEQLGLPTDSDFFQATVLLYWLRFVAANLTRYPAFQSDARWLKNNVFLVLKRGI